MQPSGSQYFPASYDSTTKIISAAVIVVLVAAIAATKIPIVAGITAGVIILSYAYSPRGYAVVGRSIAVRRLIGKVRIPLDGIRELRTGSADDFRGCLRLWGSGGVFGYYGLFRTSRLGKCTWYVTNRRNTVVLITEAQTAVFSPDDVDNFIAAIRASVPVPQTMPGDLLLDSMRAYGSGRSTGKLIGTAIGAASIGLVAFAMLYAPGPPSYTLTPEALTIHDRFYPVTVKAAAVDVERIRIVDLGVDSDWRPTARTNGFANFHYRSGWFRVANGQKVRMYRADSRRVVMLPPKGDGTPVLMEVSQPENFVQQLRQEWSQQR